MTVARDPGLQPERTVLAWERTAFSAVVVAALMLRHAAESGWGAATVPAMFASGTAVVAIVSGRARRRSLATGWTGANARSVSTGVLTVMLVASALSVCLVDLGT